MNQIIFGQIVTVNEEHKGTELVMVMHSDLCGNVPGPLRNIAKKVMPPGMYQGIFTLAKAEVAK